MIAEAGLPPLVADFTLDSFPAYGDAEALLANKALAEWLDEWTATEARWLLLRGDYGTGKTGRAVGVLKALVGRMGWDCSSASFVVASDFVRELYQSINDKSDKSLAGDLLRRYWEADVLVLDDVGADHITGYVASMYYGLLNHRLNFKRPTIITTNLDEDALAVHLSERVWWRVVQAIGGLDDGMIVCGGINLHDPKAIAEAKRLQAGSRPDLRVI